MRCRSTLAAAMAVGTMLVAAPAAMAVVPIVTVSDPVDLAPNEATLYGTVNPSALTTTFHFEWDSAGSDFCQGSPTAVAGHVTTNDTVEAYEGNKVVTQRISGLVPEADYCFRLAAQNASGTATSSIQGFHTPPKPPETALFERPSGLVTTRTVEMGFNSSVDGALFECSLDDGAWSACQSPTVLTGLADGQHTFAVRAVDQRTGLEDPTPAISSFRVAAPQGGGATTGGGTTGGGTPPGPGVTLPTPVVAAPKVARAGHAKLKGSKLTTGQRVTCAGAGDACRVTVKLVASAKGSKKLVSVGSAKATVAAGATKAIAVKLNAKGRKLLKKAGALKVVSTVTVKRGTRIPVTSGLKFNVKKKK